MLEQIKSPLDQDLSLETKSPNYKGWYLSQSLTSASKSTIDPFLPIFARSIGATVSQIGLLFSLFGLINISQVIWARLSTKLQKFRVFIFLGNLISALLFIPMALLKFGQLIILFSLRFLQSFSISAAIPTETSLLAEYVSQNERTKRFTSFTQINLLGIAIGTLIGSLIFSYLTTCLLYDNNMSLMLIFLWTGLLGILGALIFFVSVPEFYHGNDLLEAINHDSKSNPLQLNQLMPKNYLVNIRNYWYFCGCVAVFYLGINLASPFLIVFIVEDYGFTASEVGFFTTIYLFTQILTVFYCKRYNFLDRFSKKLLILISLSLISLSSIAIILPHHYDGFPVLFWTILVWIIMGIGWGVFNITIAVFLLEVVDPTRKTTLIAIYNTLVALMIFLGSIIGCFLIELTKNFSSVFLLRGFFSFCTFFMIIFVKEFRISNMTYPVHKKSKRLYRFFFQLKKTIHV
ncbi:MAG: MFS transporter [Candidatus Hermodarchaeota archaeon]